MNAENEIQVRLIEETGLVEFHQNGHWIYEVDLNTFINPIEALDRIRQLSEKSWITTRLISKVCTLAMGVIKNVE